MVPSGGGGGKEKRTEEEKKKNRTVDPKISPTTGFAKRIICTI